MSSEQLEGRSGTLYGIGLGPGDPELITVKGLRLLRAAAVVFLPTRRPGAESYAGRIAARYLEPDRQEIVPLVYPAGRGELPSVGQWEANADAIAARLQGGRRGAFLAEGDPLLYSTFVHALLPLRERHPEVVVEVVPGVWSGSAAAAAIAAPLVDGAERLAVLPGLYAGADLCAALREYDTVVLLKPGADLESLHDTIREAGASAVWVRRVGRPEQQVVRDLDALPAETPDYFSLLIVRGRAGEVRRGERGAGATTAPDLAASPSRPEDAARP